MQDILTYIVKNIVTLPDEVNVTEELVGDLTTYSITVNSADVGRVIGKEGKVIKAIRTVMRTIAIQKSQHVRVVVVSDDQLGTPVDDTVTIEV